MALRFILVSLVACLGLELPQGGDVATWAARGRAWLATCTRDLGTLGGEAAHWVEGKITSRPDSAPLAARPAPQAVGSAATLVGRGDEAPSRLDETFEAITEAMAQEFDAQPPGASTTAAPAALALGDNETEPVVAEVDANRIALATPAPQPADHAADLGEEARGDRTPATVERLHSAIRQTDEAVRAWAALVQTIGSDERCVR